MVCMFCREKTIALVKTHSGEFCGGNAAISAKAKDFANFCRPAAQQLLRQRLRWWGCWHSNRGIRINSRDPVYHHKQLRLTTLMHPQIVPSWAACCDGKKRRAGWSE
jgi:hypothetical protein